MVCFFYRRQISRKKQLREIYSVLFYVVFYCMYSIDLRFYLVCSYLSCKALWSDLFLLIVLFFSSLFMISYEVFTRARLFC